MRELDEITGTIVDVAVRLHMELALEKRGFQVERQKPIEFEYDGLVFAEAFRIDLLVEGCVVVELKSIEKLAPVHTKQLFTYLRLMNLHVGFLLNFGAATLKEGLHRVVNNLPLSASPSLRVNQSPQKSSASPRLRASARINPRSAKTLSRRTAQV